MAPRGPDSHLQEDSQAGAETPRRNEAAISGWEEEEEEETFGIKGI